MSQPFLGQITMFGFNFNPRGWAKCDGQLLPISSNQALFSLLGTTYGGDGRTTFGLPDMRGRVPLHQGQGPGLSPRQMGARIGAEDATISANEMPAHSHGMNYAPKVASKGRGRYQAQGMMMHMPGHWQLVFGLRSAQHRERITVDYRLD